VADPRTTASTAASVQRDLRALLRTHEGLALRAGAAAPEIAREAREWQADLVVLGSSGQGWLSRLLVGSVAEELLANPPASLLLVPPTPVEGLDAALIRSAAQPAFAGA
jgi:nucleotide-binding universal stress UspA family protein